MASVFVKNYLTPSAKAYIFTAFGANNGEEIIRATNIYLGQLTDPQSIAAYVNQDPMMVCDLPISVSFDLPLRWIVSTDGASYFESGIVASEGFEAEFYAYSIQLTPQAVMIGSHNISSPYARNIIGAFNSNIWLGIGNHDDTAEGFTQGVIHDIYSSTKKENCFVFLDGNKVIEDANFDDRSSRQLYFFADNNTAQGANQYFYGKLAHISIESGDGDVLFAAFLDGQRTKMININTATELYKHGTFSIEYTDKQGNPWTPGT